MDQEQQEPPWRLKMRAAWEKTKAGLRWVSIGKYDSILSLKGSTQHSSAFGGLITIVLTVFLLVFTVDVFVKLIKGNHYSLDEFSSSISALALEKTGDSQFNLTDKVVPCSTDTCDGVRVKDFLPLITDIQYIITFKGLKQPANCSFLSGNLSFLYIGASKTVTVATLKFLPQGDTSSCYAFWSSDEIL